MKLNKKIGIFLAATLVLFTGTKVTSHAEYQYRQNWKVVVDGEEKCTIMALEDSYENNTYISASEQLSSLNHQFLEVKSIYLREKAMMMSLVSGKMKSLRIIAR